MYRKPVRNSEPVTAETSQREQCVGGAQLIIKPCGICEGSAQKLEAVFWEAESALITVLWVILLNAFAVKVLQSEGGQCCSLLSFHFIVTGFSTQWMCMRTSRSSMSFISSVIFSPFSLTALKKKKNYLWQGILSFFFFSFPFLPFFLLFLSWQPGWCLLHSLLLVIKNPCKRDTSMLITSSCVILMIPIMVFSPHNRQWVICAE